MSFNVTFYTFTKKANSTARPSASGSTYACVGKSPLSMTSPRLQLKLADGAADNPAAWNYAYIPSFNRYYHVTEWTNSGPIWEAALQVDALASWKTQIGDSTLYVYRSSYEQNGQLADAAYPQLAEPHITQYDFPKVWTIGGANDAGIAANTCVIVAGIISESGTKFYAFSWDNWNRFYTKLFSNDYYEDVLGEFGATEYPEAKVAINPLQYISSALIVPTGIGAGRYCIHYDTTVSSIPVGNVTVTPASLVAYRLNDNPQAPEYYRFNIPSTGFYHPQAATRGVWLNYTPATEYTLFYPPIGEIPLEPSLICFADAINVYLHFDYKAGTCMLDLNSQFNTGTANAYSVPLYRGEFAMGCPLQLTNVLKTGTNIQNQSYYNGMELLLNGAFSDNGLRSWANSLTSKVPIVGGTISNGVQAAVHGAVPKLSAKGSFGSTANMGGQPRLIVTHWQYAQDDNACKGRPLCFPRQISTIPGFITAEADELAIPCTASELSSIRSAVYSGFFYE